jgi:hypothetical protein
VRPRRRAVLAPEPCPGGSWTLPLRSSTSYLIPIVGLLSPPGVAAVGASREPDLSPIARFAVAVRERHSPASALGIDRVASLLASKRGLLVSDLRPEAGSVSEELCCVRAGWCQDAVQRWRSSPIRADEATHGKARLVRLTRGPDGSRTRRASSCAVRRWFDNAHQPTNGLALVLWGRRPASPAGY